MDLSKNKRFSTQKVKNNVPSTEKRKKVPVCKMLHLSPLNLCPPQYFQIYLKIIAYRGKFTIPTSSKLEPLTSGQRIFKKIEIKQSRHLHFQKEEPWNKVWNLHSPKPNSARRNQLSQLCNLELGDKGSNWNIKIDFFVLR